MEGAPFLLRRRPQQQVRWQGPHLLVAGHVPHGRHLPTTCGRLLFGAHSSSRLLVASVPLQLCYIDHSAVELPTPHPSNLFSPRSASMLHRASPRAASTTTKIARRLVYSCRVGAEAYARRATDKHTGINLRRTSDVDFAC